MTDHTATPIVDSRTRMLPPLAVFFAACFLFAGAVKFHVKGGDLWITRPMGWPVTLLLLLFVAWIAARWFFGLRPKAVPRLLLGGFAAALPLMGLLAVASGTDALQGDAAPLGGALGAMLAGPHAFGALGPTVAGILFAILLLVGLFVGRRIVMSASDAPAAAEPLLAAEPREPFRREVAPAMEDDGGAIAVLDEEEADAPPHMRGELFPHDAELEPEPEIEAEEPDVVTFEIPRPMSPTPTPMRAPVLKGLVEEVDDEVAEGDAEVEEDTSARIFASMLEDGGLFMGGGDGEDGGLDLEEAPFVPAAPQLDPEEDGDGEIDLFEDDTDDDAEVDASVAFVPPAAHIAVTIEETDAIDEVDAEVEAVGRVEALTIEEPEVAVEQSDADFEPEIPPVAAEWLAAPAAFHTPRAIEQALETSVADAAALDDLLDVSQIIARAAALAEAPETPAEPEIVEVVDVIAVPEAGIEAPVERPRYRVKAVVEEAPAEEVIEEEPAVAEEAPAAFVPEIPREEPVEAQLTLPVEETHGTPESADAEEEGAPRTRRRMRSAKKKDWATWEDAPSAERPKLRLVRSDEVAEQTKLPGVPAEGNAFDRAVKLVIAEDRCSVSLLQRNLGCTFGEATALIDRMYQQGIVGPYQPSGRRDVLVGKAAAAEDEG